MRLNLGCGREQKPGYYHIDIMGGPGVDYVGDIADPQTFGHLAADSVTHIHMAHILEHIYNPLPMFDELYRVAAPDCLIDVRVPHGACDMAFADPQHVRQYFPASFEFFGQPAYARADYNYSADWSCDEIGLYFDAAIPQATPKDVLVQMIQHGRNYVQEMRAILKAVKPARPVNLPDAFNPKISMYFVRP